MIIVNTDQTNEIAMLIETTCKEHITTDGLRFYGTSWAEISVILQRYGYDPKPPF